MDTIRTLIVDDEPPARRRILELLEHEAQVELLEPCNNGKNAIAAIRRYRPALVFLDVQMPELDGFSVLAQLEAEERPVTIFVTAYDRYALQAFEVHALDYLLKPYSDQRFETAFARAKTQLQPELRATRQHKMQALLDKREPHAPPQLDRLVIKSGDHIFFLKTEEIDWIEAAGVYVKLHVGRKTHLYRETMSALASKLDSKYFVRIHRSCLVNLERIKNLQPHSHGDFLVFLHDDTRLKLSRGYRETLQARLGQTL